MYLLIGSEHFYQRRKILYTKGDDPTILDSLLKDAQIWTEFRTKLQREADDMITFIHEYNRRHNEISFDNVQGMVQPFLNRVNEKIDQLDETSKALISDSQYGRTSPTSIVLTVDLGVQSCLH